MQYQIQLLKKLIAEIKAHSLSNGANYNNSIKTLELQLDNLEQGSSNLTINGSNSIKLILQIKNQMAEYMPTEELRKLFEEKYKTLGKLNEKDLTTAETEIQSITKSLNTYIQTSRQKVRNEVFEIRKIHIQDSSYNKRLFENNDKIKSYKGELGIFAQHFINWLHQFFEMSFIIGFDENDQAILIAKMQDVRNEIRSILSEPETVKQFDESIINCITQSYLWHTVARWQAQSTYKICDAKCKYKSQETSQLEDIKEKNEFLNDIQLNLVLNESKSNYVAELQAKFIMVSVFQFLSSEAESKGDEFKGRQKTMYDILCNWDSPSNKRKEPFVAIEKLKEDGCVYLDFTGLIYKALCKAIQFSIFNVKHEFTGIVNKLSSPVVLKNKMGEVIMENKITDVEAEILNKIQSALKLAEVNKNSYMKVLDEIIITLKNRIFKLEGNVKVNKPTAQYYVKLLKMITASQKNIKKFEAMVKASTNSINSSDNAVFSLGAVTGITHFQTLSNADSNDSTEMGQSTSSTLKNNNCL